MTDIKEWVNPLMYVEEDFIILEFCSLHDYLVKYGGYVVEEAWNDVQYHIRFFIRYEDLVKNAKMIDIKCVEDTDYCIGKIKLLGDNFLNERIHSIFYLLQIEEF